LYHVVLYQLVLYQVVLAAGIGKRRAASNLFRNIRPLRLAPCALAVLLRLAIFMNS
jgi:hypothetical protein